MAGAQPVSEGARLQWWARLALWTLVITFGYLYLSSVKLSVDEKPVPDRTEQGVSPVQAAAVDQASESSPPAPADVRAESADAETAGPRRAAVNATPEASAAPVHAAESAVFVDTLMETEPVAESETASEAPVVESRPPAPLVPPPPAVAAPTPEPAAGSVAPAVETAPKPPIASGPVPVATPEAASVAPAPEASDAAVTETAEERRARIMAEYEAMRRQAVPAYPGRSRPSGRVPYGYPGYGYGPYYAPGQGNR